MPELPEVETIVRGLRRQISGKVIESVEVLDQRPLINSSPAEFKKFTKRETIKTVERLGKYLLFQFVSGKIIVAHLRMTGKYIVLPQNQLPDLKHIRLIFHFQDNSHLYYKDVRIFGTLKLYYPGQLLTEYEKNSIDPLDEAFTPQYLLERLCKKTIPIKTAMLEQTIISGMGNIYASESLFLALIHPLQRANTLTIKQVTRLTSAIKGILALAIEKNGTSISDFRNVEDERGDFQELLQVYQKDKQHCCKCRQGIIQRIVIASRSTFFCPVCQK
jgi:formamidopyrimidine-DNA glycosylase